MIDKDNFEKGIGITSKNHACDMCGAYECNGNDCRLYQEYTAKVQECYELKQTLTEIKEIAEEQQSWNEINSQHAETESEDDIFAYNWSALKQILQKISECEV